MWSIYTVEYYSAVKKNEIVPFAATWMDIQIIILSEVSQKEKDKYHISLTCRIYNMTQVNSSVKQEQTHRHRTDLWEVEGLQDRGVDWKFGISKCKLLYVGWISNRSYHMAQGTVFKIL